jgi:hypothetical protein
VPRQSPQKEPFSAAGAVLAVGLRNGGAPDGAALKEDDMSKRTDLIEDLMKHIDCDPDYHPSARDVGGMIGHLSRFMLTHANVMESVKVNTLELGYKSLRDYVFAMGAEDGRNSFHRERIFRDLRAYLKALQTGQEASGD